MSAPVSFMIASRVVTDFEVDVQGSASGGSICCLREIMRRQQQTKSVRLLRPKIR